MKDMSLREEGKEMYQIAMHDNLREVSHLLRRQPNHPEYARSYPFNLRILPNMVYVHLTSQAKNRVSLLEQLLPSIPSYQNARRKVWEAFVKWKS